jgi:dienelactone hydrolase
MKNHQVQIPSDSAMLEGELTISAESPGIVLFAHGSGSSRHSPRNQFVARTIREAGVGTLLFDLLTRDEESEDVSTGHLRFNIGLLTKRLVDATLWLEGLPDARRLGLGFFGASTGAAAALAAAAEIGLAVDAVVSRGGRPDLAGESLARVTAPTLLLVGALDPLVLRLNEQALANLRCEKKLTVVPNASHLFEEPGALDAVARLAAEWFRLHLRPR